MFEEEDILIKLKVNNTVIQNQKLQEKEYIFLLMYYEIAGISNVLRQTWKWAGGLIL
jgi:hypothetical protein